MNGLGGDAADLQTLNAEIHRQQADEDMTVSKQQMQSKYEYNVI